MKIHISYETAKKIKEFLGKKAPESLSDRREYYDDHGIICYMYCRPVLKEYSHAYQLHDLLSKPFCEAFAKQVSIKINGGVVGVVGMFDCLSLTYFKGGLTAVEKALMGMMEAGK